MISWYGLTWNMKEVGFKGLAWDLYAW